MPIALDTELTREILALKSYSQTETLIANLSEAQKAAQAADNVLWSASRGDADNIKRVGSIEFFEIPAGSALGVIRNRSRVRFNLPALGGNASDADAERAASFDACWASSLKWF